MGFRSIPLVAGNKNQEDGVTGDESGYERPGIGTDIERSLAIGIPSCFVRSEVDCAAVAVIACLAFCLQIKEAPAQAGRTLLLAQPRTAACRTASASRSRP